MPLALTECPTNILSRCIGNVSLIDVSPAANDNQDEMAEPECAGTSKLFRLDMLMWLAVTAAFYSVHHCHMRQAPQNTSTT